MSQPEKPAIQLAKTLAEKPAIEIARATFQVAGGIGCIIGYANAMAGLSVAAGSLFFLIVLNMISKPLSFLKNAIFDLITFVFVAVYAFVCGQNQSAIQDKSMPAPWIRNNVIVLTLVLIHLLCMVSLPEATSLTMALIAVFVSMQYVIAKYFTTDG